MGQSYSTRRDLYLHQFVNPRVQEHSTQIMIRGTIVPGENRLVFPNQKLHCNPFSHLVSDRDPAQQAVILGMYVLFINNEIESNVELIISDLFTRVAENQDVNHPDDSGQLRILCPAGYNRSVEGNDRILYKPRLSDKALRAYAGLDEAILKDSGVQLGGDASQLHLLPITHPLIHFIITHQEELEPVHGDMTKHESSGHFEIRPEFMARVRQYYSDNIHKDMRPTRFDDTTVYCAVGSREEKEGKCLPNVTVILQVDYLMVVPGERKMKHNEVRV